MTEQNPSRFIGKTDWLLLRNIICIAAGVLLWLYPDAFANGIVIGLGILLIIYGVVAFGLSFRRGIRSAFIHTATINAIVSFVAGLAFVLASSFFAQWFTTVTGIIIVLLSLLQLIEITALRKHKQSASALLYLSPVALLAVGVLVVIQPEGMIHLAGYLCAGALIYTGCSGIFLAIKLRQSAK